MRLSGRKDCESYFVDPSKPPDAQNPAAAPIPPPDNPATQKNQADMAATQQKLQLEQAKAQSDQQREAAQAQSQIAIDNQKFELEKQLKLLDAQIAAQKHQMGHRKSPASDGDAGAEGAELRRRLQSRSSTAPTN